MSNTKKDITLGMPHGTANGRLRKNIIFHLLTKHGENVCVRCKRAIEKVEDLSIEHIKPWEGISADLFWDLDNIAFSHLRCNVPHVRGGFVLRKSGPEGTAWCIGHRDFLPVAKFHKNENHWNGLQPYCIDCRKEERKIDEMAESTRL